MTTIELFEISLHEADLMDYQEGYRALLIDELALVELMGDFEAAVKIKKLLDEGNTLKNNGAVIEYSQRH